MLKNGPATLLLAFFLIDKIIKHSQTKHTKSHVSDAQSEIVFTLDCLQNTLAVYRHIWPVIHAHKDTHTDLLIQLAQIKTMQKYLDLLLLKNNLFFPMFFF